MRDDTAKRLSLFLLILILFGFFFGVIRVFTLRFQTGDIYPPYSSFRSDPLGCRGLYDALIHTGAVDVRRNVTPLHRLAPQTDITVFVPGVNAADMSQSVPQSWFDAVDTLVKSGARLVIGYAPSRFEASPEKNDIRTPVKPSEKKAPVKKAKNTTEKPTDKKGKHPEPETAPDTPDDEPYPVKRVDLYKAWGFAHDFAEKAEGTARPAANALKTLKLHDQTWHSSGFFTGLAKAWKPVYTVNGRVVLMERPLGRGSLVMASDSFFMSNEALKNEPNPILLAYLAGKSRTILFDESHFGIRTEPGITGLVRHFGLQGFAASVALFCLLYLWKNSGSFIPPRDEEEVPGVSARDQISGLAGLYEKNIRDKDLLTVCVAEWEKTAAAGRYTSKDSGDIRNALRALAAGNDGAPPDPVSGFRDIKRRLSEKEFL